MRKLSVLFLSAVMVIVLATGCSNQTPGIDDPDGTSDADHNPFKSTDSEIISSIGHGFTNLSVDETGRGFLNYDGGELVLDYSVHASGIAKNVGFLVFVDGIPQPYKFNTIEAPYEYMYIFEWEEDDKDTPFTFAFSPVTGRQGDTLSVNIVSMYNPAFIPDMKETQGYGNYHSTLEMVRPIIFNADAAIISSVPQHEYLSNIRLSTEPITPAFLDTLDTGFGTVNMEELSKQIFSQLFIDGSDLKGSSNLQIKQDGMLHVVFKIVGHPGVTYKNTLYINHKALSGAEGVSFETMLTKGESAVVEADIDLEKLEDLNTFYIVSVPSNASDFPNDVIAVMKTQSILLYK